MKLIPALALATASFSSLVTAQTERDLDSHEHGAALLNVAIDDGALLIELDTPWNNLVGFEHAPGNDEQQALVNDALAKLRTPGELFSFVGTDCVAAGTTLENNLPTEADGDHEHEEEHDDDEHGDGKHDEHDDDAHGDEKHDDDSHGDEKHDEHEDEAHHDEHDHEGEETHSSVLALYNFDCSDVKSLSAIEVNLLNVWSGFETISAQLIGPGGQTSAELSPQQITVDVSPVQ